MRKILAVGGAAVVLAAFYLRVASRAGLAGRALIGLVFGGFLVAAALGSTSTPRAVAQLPPSFDPASVSGSISAIQTGWGVSQPIVIHFSAPMATASVQASLRISPRAEIRLEWDASASELYVAPVVGWTPGTVYTVTVGAGAQAQDGAILELMPPAIVHVRPAATAELTATRLVGDDRIALDSGFLISFSRAVDLAGLRDALTIDPPADGTFAFEGSRSSMPDVVWVPSAPLAPDTTYVVSLASSAVDLDGAPLAEPPSLTMQTVTRPSVVRFRPRDGWQDVDPGQLLSVRFTEAMDQASTRAAYHLFAVDKKGKRSEVDLSKAKGSWAEGDTVLVLDPPGTLARGTTYIAEILPSARSSHSVPISDDPDLVARATFTVAPEEPAPTARPPAATAPPPAASPKPSGGGSSTAPWLAAEKYYLDVLNCTHTGGWLARDGSCPGRGSNGLPPLILDSRLSDCASRPWAKYLAETNQLIHGDTGGRFAACHYNVNWGENVTWNTYDVSAGAISSVIFFQNEKGTSHDGHYRNLMNSRFTHAGIGIWRLNGKNWYVVDFWGN